VKQLVWNFVGILDARLLTDPNQAAFAERYSSMQLLKNIFAP